MNAPVNLTISLPDEYLAVETFDTKFAAVDQRLSDLEADATAVSEQRIADLEALVAALKTELEAIKQDKASTAEVETLTTTVDEVRTRITAVDQRLGDVSFGYGDVAAYEAAGDLPAQQLFIVVDSPDKLSALTDKQLERTGGRSPPQPPKPVRPAALVRAAPKPPRSATIARVITGGGLVAAASGRTAAAAPRTVEPGLWKAYGRPPAPAIRPPASR